MFTKITLIVAVLSFTICQHTVYGGKARIVGGASADISKFPHQVSLTYFNYFTEQREHICGGTIIGPNVILTAAHCTTGPIAMTSTFEVRVGSTSSLTGGKLIKVDSIINHENYNGHTIDNDVALLVLKENIVFSNDVRSIPLATTLRDPGTVATVSGWGFLQQNAGIPSPTLQFVDVPLIKKDSCEAMLGETLTASMMCAGYPEGGKDSCTTDSGGPLIQGGEVIGVVSWGIGCAQKDSPGIYTSVFYMRDWIVTQLANIKK